MVRRASSIAVKTARRSARIRSRQRLPWRRRSRADRDADIRLRSAGASLMPSPTITTCAPPPWRCSFLTRSAFCEAGLRDHFVDADLGRDGFRAFPRITRDHDDRNAAALQQLDRRLEVGLIGSEIAITA